MKTWIEISKQKLLHNVDEITKRLKPETRFMAILKSNAYGHGIMEIANLLQAASYRQDLSKGGKLSSRSLEGRKAKLWFGVDSIGEVLTLQKIPSLRKVPILILGYTPIDDLKKIPENTRQVIYNFETIQAMGKINKKFKVHIKVETGTQRQGIDIKELPGMIKAIKRLKNIEVEGISSHFAEAENLVTTQQITAQQNYSLIRANKRIVEPSKFTKQQLKNFYAAAQTAEKLLNKRLIKHIACSAAASHFKKSQCDMVRVGINMYGLQSIDPRIKHQKLRIKELLNLRPALTWKTMVAQIKNVKKRVPIGYGHTETMPYDGQVAVLPIGYWDGYDRRLSSIGEALIGGKRCKIIGRVCMNICMVLLPRGLKIKPEDEAILIGKQGEEEITADELAQKIGTINYEVVTRINPLIPRVTS